MTPTPMRLVPAEPTEEFLKATRELITECDFLLIGLSMSDPQNLRRAPAGAGDVLPTFLPALKACFSALEALPPSPNAGQVSREQRERVVAMITQCHRHHIRPEEAADGVFDLLGLSVEGEN